MVTGNWEEELLPVYRSALGGGVRAPNLVTDITSAGVRQSRGGVPSPRFDA
jgi:hypothetical protein